VTRQNLYYLASPYTHSHASIREGRASYAAMIGASLKRLGLHIFAPIPHGHALAEFGLPLDFNWWNNYSYNVLSRCDGLIVAMINGWDESKGVAAEIKYAEEHGIPVVYLSREQIWEFDDQV